MPEQDIERIAREQLEAFSKGDFTRLEGLVAPDAVLREPGREAMKGWPAILKSLQNWRRAFPDARATVVSAVTGGDHVVLEVKYEGTHSGPLDGPGGTIPPSGKRVAMEGAQLLTFQGGKIKEIHEYFDSMALMQQIGALPAATAR